MSMPGGFYTCPDQFNHEAATLLHAGWQCLGREDEIPEPGDYFTVQLLNEPLIVVRDDDGNILIHANACRHRGMPLAEGSGNTNRFVCPYHAWTYGRDGSLLRAARMVNAGFDPASCKLHSHKMQLWNGFIYVNLSGEAEPFCFPELDELVEHYEPTKFRLVHVEEGPWLTNWKCLVENFMEGYHLSVVHPQTLHGYTPTGSARKLVAGDGFTSYAANYPEGIETRGNGSDKLSKAERNRSTLFALFPTQVVSQAATLLVSLYIFPISADEVWVKWTVSTYGDEFDEYAIEQRIALWAEVNREDREKLERLQVALRSAHAVSGPLAGEDYEGTIRDFQIWLAAQDTKFTAQAQANG